MTTQYCAHALRAGLARLHARMRMHMPKRPGNHMQARTHARTHTHAYTDQNVILIAFPQKKRFANAPHCYVKRAFMLLFL